MAVAVAVGLGVNVGAGVGVGVGEGQGTPAMKLPNAKGELPTVTMCTTVLVDVSMTETVLLLKFAT